MKKQILPLIALVVACFALLHPVCMSASASATPASLTLHYEKEGAAFAHLPIGIYRVAEICPDGSYRLIEPFASYPLSLHDITRQEQWQHLTQTVEAYLIADRISPDREANTDESGTVHFADLKTGLYFVREVVAEHTDGSYVFSSFLVYVPTPQPDGTQTYAVEAKPKCTGFVPKSQYTVTKLWQDGGHQDARPQEVTVDIYKDGVLSETKALSADNNWSYTWSVSGDTPAKWTVVERSVPSVYQVTVQQNGAVFSIINTYTATTAPPQTGDSFSPLLWVLVMCFSGMMLLVLGVYRWRQG